MAATVEDLCVDDPEEDAGQEGAAFVSQLDHELRERLHITINIGAKDASVPAVEVGALVQSFKKGEKGVEGVYVKQSFSAERGVITPVILSCYH
jgi:hypothetical protein